MGGAGAGGERGGGEGPEEDDKQHRWPPKPQQEQCGSTSAGGCGSSAGVVELKLVVEDPDFDLERAVCSHGLFMMAPNHWDPATRTFKRPLRLRCPSSTTSSLSVVVRISHPYPRPSVLRISVLATDSLSTLHQEALLAQVRRMLRISAEDDRVVKEFRQMHPAAKERGFGRIFRSPTLFEDMVKCILLCNCQWSRTLSMARALCELQLELKGCSAAEHCQPRTPQRRELKGKCGCKRRISVKLKIVENEAEMLTYSNSGNNDESTSKCLKTLKSDSGVRSVLKSSCDPKPCDDSKHRVATEGMISPLSNEVGDFPTPEELAGFDEDFLARRCGLGYRAKRIISLARSIVEGKIRLEEFEKICDVSNSSSYEKLNEQLLSLDGFGPFTCANVLMCMGFYHKIPWDSETIRHLKQFHLRSCNSKVVEKHAEDIYGQFAPFQFLAYWSELWHFYEERFGKLSEMPPSDYGVITANNMRGHRTVEKRGVEKFLTEE